VKLLVGAIVRDRFVHEDNAILDYGALPIGSTITLSGAEVRLKAYLETLGFCVVREHPGVPATIVMRRDTGPLLPVLRLVG
jgi:hypothetical protein